MEGERWMMVDRMERVRQRWMETERERERELMSDQRERISHMGSIKLLESRYITSKSKKSKNIYKKTTQIFSNTNIW